MPIPHEVETVGRAVLDAALTAHRKLGPGLLESVYENCPAHELSKAGMRVDQQLALPVTYDEIWLDVGYRVDLLVHDAVVVEVKATEALTPVHLAQVLTYLRFSGRRLGFLINFNTVLVRHNIRRVVWSPP
jgi:GxxExxY protein